MSTRARLPSFSGAARTRPLEDGCRTIGSGDGDRSRHGRLTAELRQKAACPRAGPVFWAAGGAVLMIERPACAATPAVDWAAATPSVFVLARTHNRARGKYRTRYLAWCLRLCGNQILGAPRHRRDGLKSVAASARHRGDSTPSTRRCRRNRVGSTAWRLTKVHAMFPHRFMRR